MATTKKTTKKATGKGTSAKKTTKKVVADKSVETQVEEAVKTVQDEEVNNTVIPASTKETEINEEPKVEVKPRTYAEDEYVLCTSLTGGELIHIGIKSGTRYIFADRNDTCEIEARDLNALKSRKSSYLYDPLFVINDEEFIAQPRWKDIKEMYDSLMGVEIDEILELPNSDFERIVKTLPKGYKNALVEEISTRIHNDDFDSIKKVRIIDELFNTDLMSLVSK